jgi:hypothetical protein
MKPVQETEVKQRKPYVKPQLGIVSLVPKQTVLGGCFSVSITVGSDPLLGTCAAAVECMNGA